MNCDKCQQQMNYAFYINDEFWCKVVSEDSFNKSVGRWCAHCTLEKLGGASWYIIWNEPTENIRRQTETTLADQADFYENHGG